MQERYSVEVIGFNDTERIVIASIFNLSTQRTPGYGSYDRARAPGAAPDLFLVDADDPPSVATLLKLNPDGVVRTVLIGASDHDSGWPVIERPLQWARLFAALDASVGANVESATVPAEPMPASQPAAPDLPQASSTAAPTAEDVPSRRVLIVDDSPSVRRFLATKLEGLGLEVDQAECGEDAIGRAAKVRYACILLDLGLPGIDGFQTCRLLKSPRSLARAPVVIVTARHSPIDRWRAGLAGCDAYLTKPLEGDALRQAIERLIGAPSAVAVEGA